MSHSKWHIGPLGLFLNFFGELDAVWLIKRIESETVVERGGFYKRIITFDTFNILFVIHFGIIKHAFRLGIF